jgi:hypothetical protein
MLTKPMAMIEIKTKSIDQSKCSTSRLSIISAPESYGVIVKLPWTAVAMLPPLLISAPESYGVIGNTYSQPSAPSLNPGNSGALRCLAAGRITTP